MSEGSEKQQSKRKNASITEQEVFDSVLAVDGIQVNHCKDPLCANFNFPYADRADNPNCKRGWTIQAPLPLQSASNKDDIKHPALGKKLSVQFIQYRKCNECPPLKSNQGISDILKLWDYHPNDTSCPNDKCQNHHIPITTPGHYKRNGKTKTGTVRWLCKASRLA